MRNFKLAPAVVACLGVVGPPAVEADPGGSGGAGGSGSEACAGTSAIDGIAVDGAGHGVPGVGVHVEPADHDSGWSATTGSDGRFHIDCVRVGGAYVEAGTETLATTPQVITVAAGKPARVRFEMVATVIAGVVIAVGGGPAATAVVSIKGPLDGANNEGEDVAVDAQGRFAIRGVPPGRYHLEARVGKFMVETVVTTADDHLRIQMTRTPRS
jgi:hypothetical protein|nr:carboxypeptidase-like regulatory domain-containing protein [Kofleriaceae bacterium]